MASIIEVCDNEDTNEIHVSMGKRGRLVIYISANVDDGDAMVYLRKKKALKFFELCIALLKGEGSVD